MRVAQDDLKLQEGKETKGKEGKSGHMLPVQSLGTPCTNERKQGGVRAISWAHVGSSCIYLYGGFHTLHYSAPWL